MQGSQTETTSSQSFSFLFSRLCSLGQYFLKKKKKCKTAEKIWVLTSQQYSINGLLHNVMLLNVELSSSFLELCHIAHVHCYYTKLLFSALLTVCLSLGHIFGSGIFPLQEFAELTPTYILSTAAFWFSYPNEHKFFQLRIICKWHSHAARSAFSIICEDLKKGRLKLSLLENCRSLRITLRAYYLQSSGSLITPIWKFTIIFPVAISCFAN